MNKECTICCSEDESCKCKVTIYKDTSDIYVFYSCKESQTLTTFRKS